MKQDLFCDLVNMSCGKETICQITLRSLAYASRLGSSLPWGISCTEASYSKEKVILHKQLQSLIRDVPECYLWRPFVFSYLVDIVWWSRKPVPIISWWLQELTETHPHPRAHIHVHIHAHTFTHSLTCIPCCTYMHSHKQ